ncbi:hypothetical protein ILYODFUR_010807 [Ilyodon furcidens]|uniref:Interferon-induced protein 44-like n=1 Tax=Ilyodon furcidens TaxID=33524 RepID=A0ABV0UF12_9TELE
MGEERGNDALCFPIIFSPRLDAHCPSTSLLQLNQEDTASLNTMDLEPPQYHVHLKEIYFCTHELKELPYLAVMQCFSFKPPDRRLYLREPWLQMNWGDEDKQSDLDVIKSYRPRAEDQELRILLHGPAGPGKPCFINCVNSVLESKVTCDLSPVNNEAQKGFTKKYTSYKTQKGEEGNFYPFVLNEIMSRVTRRLHVKDVKKAMKGHIKDGYTFNPECSLSKSDPYYKGSPHANDKVHVQVCVFASSSEDLLRNYVMETIQDIRDDAAVLGIPQVAIFTKIGKACSKTKKVRNFYRTKLLYEKVEDFSRQTGIPEYCILHVKNYTMEKNLNDVDALIVGALNCVIECIIEE